MVVSSNVTDLNTDNTSTIDNQTVEYASLTTTQSGSDDSDTLTSTTSSSNIVAAAATTTSNISSSTIRGGTVGNGYLYNLTGTAQASNVSISGTGSMTVSGSNTSITNTNVSNGGYLYIQGGTTGYNTSASGSGTRVWVRTSGTTISNTTVTNSAVMGVYHGAEATSTTLTSYGTMSVFSGGIASSTQMSQSARLEVGSGGIIVDTVMADLYTEASVHNSAIAINTTVTNNASMIIYDNASASNTTVHDGGYLSVTSNAIISQTTIGSDGSAVLGYSASAYDTSITNGGVLSAYIGGTLSGATVTDGGTLAVYSGASAYDTLVTGNGALLRITFSGTSVFNTSVTNSASMIVRSGAIVSGTTVNSGANLSIYANGVTHSTIISDAGTLFNVASTGSAINTSVTNGASMVVLSGGIASTTTVDNDGIVSVLSGGTLYQTNVNSNGLLVINSGGILKDTVYISNGGSATIWASAGGSVSLIGDQNTNLTLTGLENGGNTTVVIGDFTGVEAGNSDSITLEGINQQDVTLVEYKDANGNDSPDHVTLTLKDGSTITLNIVGAEDSGYSLSTSGNGSLVYEVCFLTGTLIRTLLNDEIKVEDLRVGDSVMTYDWQNNQEVAKAVKWVGYKHVVVDPQAPYDDVAGYPVRISKNAIAENVPHKDLLVTPEHCLFFNGSFVPARMLVNNYSIFYDHSITEYTYYHVETEEHSVIWADGMLTETYLDTGNRKVFKQYQDTATLFAQSSDLKSWEDDACAPLLTDRSVIEPLFNELLDRAKEIGFEKQTQNIVIDQNPELHLVTDTGEIIVPHSIQKERLIFAVPSDVHSIHLASKASRPSDVVGAFLDDRRELGVLIGDITLLTPQQTYKIHNHLDTPKLQGWYNVENGPYRWTNGNALLPLEQSKENTKEDSQNILVVQIVAAGPYIQQMQG
ncbi:hypothetical protein CIN_08470 [Commensalibacter intestini A911]|uniref:Hedgehog/Intein (Hint) domain-containing protein n=1 Tax=Commensalibacter intestini A911 TaxID=1088868 RepID=G6EZH7_9PROT|nr:Hint domain-containing protein [Commensalibacter intestini]EHD14915.1 hypothetical protein CIN_08470 [Commensalibacter intestini A911]